MKNKSLCLGQEINLPFEDRVDILFREIELAARWERPSIIFAIYKSNTIRDEVNKLLEEKLRKIDQSTHAIKSGNPKRFDFLSQISKIQNLSQTVLLIDGYDWDCGIKGVGVLNEFNKHREYFIDNSIRAIFWLFEKELSDFATDATECWVLRHRVVEFVDGSKQEQDLNQIPEFLRQKAKNAPAEEYLSESSPENKALEIDANDELSWAGIGKAYMDSSQWAKAEGSLRKAVELNVHLADAWINLGKCFAQQNRELDAIAIYNKATEFNPENADIWDELGKLYLEKQNYVDCISAFHKVISLSPKNGEAHLKLAYALFQIGDFETSASIYEESLPLFSDNAARSTIWNRLGDTYLQMKDYEKAIEAYKQSGPAQVEPKSSDNIDEELSDEINITPSENDKSLEQDNSEKEAGEKMNEANQLFDLKTAAEWNEHGNAHLKAGAYNDAIAAYTKAIELAPDFCWPYIQNLAQVHYQKGKVKGRLTKGETEDPDVWEGEEESLSTSLFGLDAIVNSEKNTEEEPGLENQNKKYSLGRSISGVDVGNANANLQSTILGSINKKEKIIVEPKEKELDAAGDNGNINIGVPQNMGIGTNFSFNKTITPQFVENMPRDSIDWNELGNSFASSKKFDNAVEAYKKAIEMNPRFGQPYSNLGFMYYRLGKYDQAVLLYKKSIDLLDSPEDKAVSWNRLGDAYRRLGDYGNALTAYRRSNEMAPALSPVMARARTTLLENIVAG